MSTERRLLAAVACALAALAIASGAASAETMFFEPGGRIEAVSNGAITFESEGGSIACRLVAAGELVSSFTMSEGSEIGRLTSTRASECSGGTLLTLETNIELRYVRLLGEPLHPGGILFRVQEIGFLVTVPILFSCLYRADGGALMRINENPPVGGEFRFLQTTTIIRTVKLSGAAECPRSILLRGSLTLRPQQSVHIV